MIRAWNWPNAHSSVFSSRPTPYNISKIYGIATTSVYDEWHRLFDGGEVEKVMLLPSDSFVGRRTVIYTNTRKENFDSLVSKLGEVPFLEMVRWGKVHSSTGILDELMDTPFVMVADLVETPENVLAKRERLISDILETDTKILEIPQTFLPPNELSQRLNDLARMVSYSNILHLRLNDLSSVLNVSTKTARRWMDSLIGKGVLSAYPLLSQYIIKGFHIVLAYGIYDSSEQDVNIRNVIEKGSFLSQRYLHFSLRYNLVVIYAYYETVDEIEILVSEFKKIFHSFALLTQFENKFNEAVHIYHSK